MNQPDRYEKFVLPAGTRKVEYEADTKLEHAGSLIIRNEDHTVGNMIRMQLHSDKEVIFAGYRIPHPLESKMVVRIQTTGKDPTQAMQHAISDLRSEITELREKFTKEAARIQPQPMDMGASYP
eukprot:jgi/Chrzof1/10821/Cz05g13120.t1